MNLHLLPSGIIQILGVIGALLGWMLLDVRWVLRTMKENALRAKEGRLDESLAALRALMGTWRPWARLFIRLVTPGALEAEYAMNLDAAGRTEEAVPWAEQAAARGRGHALLGAPTLASHIHILVGVGRYDDAWKAVEELRALKNVPLQLQSAPAQVAFFQGNFDEALAVCRVVLEREPRDENARVIASGALRQQGDLRGAIEMLLYTPDPGRFIYTPQAVKAMQSSADAAQALRAIEKAAVAVFKPVRWLAAADAYAAHGDVEGLEYAVARAREVLEGNVQVEMIYRRMLARLAAYRGKPGEVAAEFEKVRELLKKVPKRSQRYETANAQGECALIEGRPADAVLPFEEALRLCLHPGEKHQTACSLGRALEALGRRDEAIARYKEVVATGIVSRYTATAKEALARLGG